MTGGQVVELAEGFSVGPATEVGVIAAMVILLITFGSLMAAGMPLITAGFGLVSGVALIGLATHLTAMSNVAPELALMIGLGVGIDYALFIVTRHREGLRARGDVELAVVEAMDTSGRATPARRHDGGDRAARHVCDRCGFMYGLAIASVLAVLLTLAASLTLLPAILSRFGERIAQTRSERRSAKRQGDQEAATVPERSRWRQWSEIVQARPWPLALVSLAIMIAVLTPVAALRLDTSDAGNDPSNTTSRQAFDMLAQGFGAGFNGPLVLVAELPAHANPAALAPDLPKLAAVPDVAAVTAPRLSRSGRLAVVEIYPRSAPQAPATTNLVNNLRTHVLPPLERASGITVLVGGFTAGSIDFSNVLADKLPLFIAIVVVLSALLLLVIFRSLVIAVQAALMNLLSIGGALGVNRRGLPMGLVRQPARSREGADRAVDPGTDLRRRVRPVDGLRGVPGVARARGMGAPARRIGRGCGRHRVHRARDQRGGGNHDLRLPVVHAGQRAGDQGVRIRARGSGVPRRPGGPLRAAAGGAGAAGGVHLAAAALARRPVAGDQHRRLLSTGVGERAERRALASGAARGAGDRGGLSGPLVALASSAATRPWPREAGRGRRWRCPDPPRARGSWAAAVAGAENSSGKAAGAPQARPPRRRCGDRWRR